VFDPKLTQLPPDARVVQPPKRVWVDLTKLFPRSVGEPYRRRRGLDVATDRARGELYYWIPTSHGDWLGFVSYEIYTDDGTMRFTMTHLIPGHMLKRRTPRSERRNR
jgi:hypothetical protein